MFAASAFISTIGQLVVLRKMAALPATLIPSPFPNRILKKYTRLGIAQLSDIFRGEPSCLRSEQDVHSCIGLSLAELRHGALPSGARRGAEHAALLGVLALAYSKTATFRIREQDPLHPLFSGYFWANGAQ